MPRVASGEPEGAGVMGVEVGGHVEPGFEPVRDTFANNFEAHGEVGAGYALSWPAAQGRRPWGGVADVTTGHAGYDDDTLQLVFSTTKGATATLHATCSRNAATSTSTHRWRATRRVRAGGQGTWCRCGGSCATRRDSLRSTRWSSPGAVFQSGTRSSEAPTRRRRHTGSPAPRTATTRSRTASSSAKSSAGSRPRQEPRHLLPRRDRDTARPRVLDRFARGARGCGLRRLIGGSAEPGQKRAREPVGLAARRRVAERPRAFNLNGAFGDSSTGANNRASTTPRRSPARTASPTRARWRACTQG